MKRGDILLQIDGQAVNTLADYRNALSSHKPGDQVKLTVTHGDDKRTLTATLGNRNGNPDLGLLVFGGGFRPGRGFFGNGPGAVISGTQTVIVNVVSGSPADKAGLKAGDVIVSIGGTKLDATHVLSQVLSTYKPGDQVTLQVISAGQSQRDVTVTLGTNPNKAGVPYLGIAYRQGGEGFRRGKGPGLFPGLPFIQVTGSGARIVSVSAGSPAEKAGLKAGDIITAVNGTAVANPQALGQAITSHKPGDTVTLSIKHSDNTTAEVKVTLASNPSNSGTAFLGVSTSPVFGQGMPYGRFGWHGQGRGTNPFGTPGGMFRFFGGGGRNQTGSQSQPVPLGNSL